MAKILMTAIVADMRNKLNGSVFSKNRYGAYVRTKVTPVNPQTTSQQATRNVLATLSAQWRGLSESERQGWINAAANFPTTDIFGNPKILSGNALYVRLNSNLFNAGISAIPDAPLPVALPAFALGTITAAAGTPALSVAFEASPVPTGFSLKVEATPQVGAGISFVKNKYRVLQYVAAAGTSPINLLSAYNAKFGTLVEGMKIFVRVTAISTTTGQAGIPISGSVIVAA